MNAKRYFENKKNETKDDNNNKVEKIEINIK